MDVTEVVQVVVQVHVAVVATMAVMTIVMGHVEEHVLIIVEMFANKKINFEVLWKFYQEELFLENRFIKCCQFCQLLYF